MAKNDKTNRITRNIDKIQQWDGESVEDIIDALDVIGALGGEYDLSKNPKKIPDQFEDISNTDGIYAVDANGRILYMDLTIGNVDDIRVRRHRVEIGLSPLDDLQTFVHSLQNDYDTKLQNENDRLERRGSKTSAKRQSFIEVSFILDRINNALNATITYMENAAEKKK